MQNSKKALLIILFIYLIIPNLVFSKTNNTSNDIQILAFQQNAIANVQYNTNVTGGDTGVTTRGDLNQAIKSLQDAIKNSQPKTSAMLQLQLSLFSLQIDTKQNQAAEKTLNYLIKEFPENPIVQIYDTAYFYVLKFKDYRESLKKLKTSKWAQMPKFIKAFDVIDRNYNLHINTSANQIEIKDDSNPVIIILGYALHQDGSMDEVLIQRLETGLEAHKEYPHAKIIVSGGGVRAGTTESYQMKQWLINKKVPSSLIIQEDQSISTIWNAFNTFKILENLKPKVKDIILITSDSHIRRANAVFEQESLNTNMDLKIHNIASETRDYNILDPLTNHEKTLIVKDTFRVAGIWQMPGMVL